MFPHRWSTCSSPSWMSSRRSGRVGSTRPPWFSSLLVKASSTPGPPPHPICFPSLGEGFFDTRCRTWSWSTSPFAGTGTASSCSPWGSSPPSLPPSTRSPWPSLQQDGTNIQPGRCSTTNLLVPSALIYFPSHHSQYEMTLCFNFLSTKTQVRNINNISSAVEIAQACWNCGSSTILDKVVNLIAVDCEKVKVAVQFISFMWSGGPPYPPNTYKNHFHSFHHITVRHDEVQRSFPQHRCKSDCPFTSSGTFWDPPSLLVRQPLWIVSLQFWLLYFSQ